MEPWIVKTQVDDIQRALEILEEQRNRGYNAWIEDDHGKAVDEESLKNKRVGPITFTLQDKGKGLVVGLAAAAAALITLYVTGLWVDH
jgi:cell division septation protein DedD